MPDKGVKLLSKTSILSFEEILRLIKVFSSLGIRHVKITGGEPLSRKNLDRLIFDMSQYIDDISITTNGTLLSNYCSKLSASGLKRINLSLDTLNKERFKYITMKDYFQQVMEGIDKIVEEKLFQLKLNVVVMKGINDDEIVDFVEYAISKNIILRFIEYMNISPLWKKDHFIPIEQVKSICKQNFALRESNKTSPGPAKYYDLEGDNLLGFIKTSEESCRQCSRLRLTASGLLKICLYENEGLPLQSFLKDGFSDEEIINEIKSRVYVKNNLAYSSWKSNKTFMNQIGG